MNSKIYELFHIFIRLLLHTSYHAELYRATAQYYGFFTTFTKLWASVVTAVRGLRLLCGADKAKCTLPTPIYILEQKIFLTSVASRTQ